MCILGTMNPHYVCFGKGQGLKYVVYTCLGVYVGGGGDSC